MANHPIPDQSDDFIKSGMILITDPRSDVLLERIDKNSPPKIEILNGVVAKVGLTIM